MWNQINDNDSTDISPCDFRRRDRRMWSCNKVRKDCRIECLSFIYLMKNAWLCVHWKTRQCRNVNSRAQTSDELYTSRSEKTFLTNWWFGHTMQWADNAYPFSTIAKFSQCHYRKPYMIPLSYIQPLHTHRTQGQFPATCLKTLKTRNTGVNCFIWMRRGSCAE